MKNLEKLKKQVEDFEQNPNALFNFMSGNYELGELSSSEDYREGILDGIKYALGQLEKK